MTKHPRPKSGRSTSAANRRRRKVRPALESLEGRALMDASQDTLNELYAAQQEELETTNEAIEQLTPEHIAAIGTGADAAALQGTQDVAGFGSAVEGPAWNQYITDLFQARSLIVASFQDYNAASPGSADYQSLEDKASNERYASVDAYRNASGDAASGYQAGTVYLASNPGGPAAPTPVEPEPTQPVVGDGTSGNPLQGGATQAFTPGSTATLDGGTQVEVDTGGGPPQEAGVDWNTWYMNWINQVNQKVFQPLNVKFAGRQETLETQLNYEVLKDGRVQILSGGVNGHGVMGESQKVYDSARNAWLLDAKRMLETQTAPLPSNTKLASIRRKFTFSLNTGAPPIKLGGPPRENIPASPKAR